MNKGNKIRHFYFDEFALINLFIISLHQFWINSGPVNPNFIFYISKTQLIQGIF